jgi:hypothetical protein
MLAIAGSAWHGHTLPVVGKLNHVAESKANIGFGVRKKGTEREGKGWEGKGRREGLPTVKKTGKLHIECAGCAFTGKYSAWQWLRQCPVRPVPLFCALDAAFSAKINKDKEVEVAPRWCAQYGMPSCEVHGLSQFLFHLLEDG